MASPQQASPFQDVIEKQKTIIFQQESFEDGMNQQVDPTRLKSTEYPLLVNGRTRYGVVEPVLLPANADPQNSLLNKKVQGIYSAGPFILIFADGKAYYRNVTLPLAPFTMITGGFQLNPLADTVWAEQVPASSKNFKRSLVNATSNTSGVNLFSSIAGSPQCVVAQDGSSQPWLIFEDGTSEIASTYLEWDKDNNREYVPIGSMMMYSSGVLYIVGDVMTDSLTTKRRQIYRSVTGRPLDFVINIDINGDKGGDANTTSYAVDYDEITCIKKLNSNDGSFFIGTAKNGYMVIPITVGVALPFNEPVFTTVPLFNTGPLNQFSMTDKSGDACFIDFGGIRSFNAVLQNRNEGRNLPFSKKVALMFATIVQLGTNVCSITYDDYCLFSVYTIYGYGVLVYDTIQEIWIGIDIYDNLAANETIVQFCEVKVGTTRKLFARTNLNKVYEIFAGSEAGTKHATCKLYVGDWCSNDVRIEQKPLNLKFVFSDVELDGTITVTPFIDRKSSETLSQPIKANSVPFATPIVIPFGDSSNDVVRNINFSLDNVSNGWKVGFLVSWNFQAQLTHIRCESTKVNTDESSDEQAASIFNS